MAKEVLTIIKLQVPAGGANPSPPVGPALGQHGLNIMDFCNAFNDKTKDVEKGLKVPVEITVFEDRSFSFILKTSLSCSFKIFMLNYLSFLFYFDVYHLQNHLITIF